MKHIQHFYFFSYFRIKSIYDELETKWMNKSIHRLSIKLCVSLKRKNQKIFYPIVIYVQNLLQSYCSIHEKISLIDKKTRMRVKWIVLTVTKSKCIQNRALIISWGFFSSFKSDFFLLVVDYANCHEIVILAAFCVNIFCRRVKDK